MPKKKAEERTYSYWSNFSDDWTKRALRSFQIQTYSKSKRRNGYEVADLPIDNLAKKISARSLDAIYMSMPPIVDHFTKGKDEVFTTVVLHDIKYNKKSQNLIVSYALNIRYGKKVYRDNFVSKEYTDNDNYEAIENAVVTMKDACIDVYENLDTYFPKAVKLQ
jgi:hypothetical protein